MAMDMFDAQTMTGKDLSFLDDLECHLIQNSEDLRQAFEDLDKYETPIALDTETEGLSPFHHHIVGVILAPSKTISYYFPLRHKIGTNCDEATFIYLFRQFAPKHKFIFFNAKFDWKMVYHHYNIDLEICGDAQIDAYCLNSDLAETKGYSLKDLTQQVFGRTPLELSDMGGYNFALYAPEEAYKYACPDGTNTYELWEYYQPKIDELHLRIVERIELSIVKPIAKMELTGVYVDVDLLKAQQQQMKDRIDELQQKIWEAAGHEYDVQSPLQTQQVLFDELKIPVPQRNGKPDRSVGAEQLKALSGKHPIIDHIKNFREVSKLYNDFVLKLPTCLAEDGRLHGELNPMGTRSGRFSASGGFGKGGQKIAVNLQQLPKGRGFESEETIKVPPEQESKFDFSVRYDESDVEKLWPEYKTYTGPGKELRITTFIPVKIRDALKPTPGYYWVSADYSQLEYRTLANMAEDENLINAFMSGVDFHQATASDMLGVPLDQVTKSQRKIGKCVSADTLIASPHGLFRIDLLSQERGEDKFDETLDFWVRNWRWEKTKAISFYSAGIHKCIHLTTNMGYSLGGSKDKHRILGWNGRAFALKKIADFVPGEKLAIRIGEPPEVPEYDKLYELAGALIGSAIHIEGNYAGITSLPETSRLLELMAAQGDGYAITFAEQAAVGNDLYTSWILKEDTLHPTVQFILQQAEMDVHRDSPVVNAKKFPMSVLTATPGQQLSFLAGLFNMAALCTSATIRVPAYYEDFITILQQLLLFLGILSMKDSAELDGSTLPVLDIIDDVSADTLAKTLPTVSYSLQNAINKVELRQRKDFVDSTGNFFIDLVEDLEETEEPLFDIFVPDGNAFVANGFPSENTINFGIVYGMTKWGLAQKLEDTPEKAEQLMTQYMKNKPKVQALTERVKSATASNGYVRTYFGRIRWFAERLKGADAAQKERILKQSFNTYIQGSSADLAKIALYRAAQMIAPYGDKFRMLTQVHDEINFEVHESISLEEAVQVIDTAMSFRGVVDGWADVPADIEWGDCYGKLRSLEEGGVDLAKTLAENTIQGPNTDWFFEQALKMHDTLGTARSATAKTPRREEKSRTDYKPAEFKTRDQVSHPRKPAPRPKIEVPQQVSAGRRQLESMNAQTQAPAGRLDLSAAKFPMTTIVIWKIPGTDDQLAYAALQKFITDNFGANDLVIENEGRLYKFPTEYRVNENYKDLEPYFEVRVFKAKPKIQITL